MEIEKLIEYLFFALMGVYLYYLKRKMNNLATKEDIRDISYEKQKGLNLATKEDIEKITNDIESVKSKFQTFIDEHQIKFHVLHNERAKFLMEFYKIIVKFHRNFDIDLSKAYNANRSDRYKIFMECRNNLNEIEEYFYQNEILIESDITDLILNFFENVNTSIKRLKTALSIEEDAIMRRDDKLIRENNKLFESVVKIVDNEIPDILDKIKINFQLLLSN